MQDYTNRQTGDSMYLKIGYLNYGDKETGRNWKIYGDIRDLNYSFGNLWTWDEYQKCRGDSEFYAGPIDKEEWDKGCLENGKQYFAHASIYFNDKNRFVFCIWNTTAFLLNDEGKTIEVISAAG